MGRCFKKVLLSSAILLILLIPNLYAELGVDWYLATGNASFEPRFGHSTVVFDNKMWVIGGTNISSQYKNDVWSSENGVDWTLVTGNAAFTGRSFHVCLVHNNNIWVIGGWDGVNVNDVWYSSNGADWTLATGNANFSARNSFGGVVYNSGGGDEMWISGGWFAAALNDIWRSSDGVSWTLVTSSPAFSDIYGHKVVNFNDGTGDKMWLVESETSMTTYNSSDGAVWNSVSSGSPETRQYFSMEAYNNKMWLVAGSTASGCLKDVWSSTDGTDWGLATGNASFSERYSHSGVVFNNKIWTIGGRDKVPALFNDVWYSPIDEPLCFVTKWGALNGPKGFYKKGGSTGLFYIADTLNNRVQAYDHNGGYLLQFGSYGTGNGQFDNPYDVAVNINDDVYVSDTNNNRIQVFNNMGLYFHQWGSAGSGNGQFSSPYGLDIDAARNVYVADSGNARIQKFNDAGTYITEWFTSDIPVDTAVDDLGNVYVATNSNDYLKKYTDTGTLIFSKECPGIKGIDVDPDKNIYVSVYGEFKVKKYDSNGNYLTEFGGTYGTGDGEFRGPIDIAVAATGEVFVLDQVNNDVSKFDDCATPVATNTFTPAITPTFTPIPAAFATPCFELRWGTLGTADGDFQYPSGSVEDEFGNIYIVDTSNDRVQKFDAIGNFITKWGTTGSTDGNFNLPAGIAIDTVAQEIFIADTANNRIQVFDYNGTFKRKWGSLGIFLGPGGMAINSGNIYIADSFNNRVKIYTTAGSLVTTFGSAGTGDGQFDRPKGVCIDTLGNVYVSDNQNHRIQKFTSAGTYLLQWGSYGTGDGQFNQPEGLVQGPDGYIYVPDGYNDRVQVFDTDGNYVGQFGTLGTGDGEFDYPETVSFAQDGSMYVVEYNNCRVHKFNDCSTPTYTPTITLTNSPAITDTFTPTFTPTPSQTYTVIPTLTPLCFITKWGSSGTGDGQFDRARGIALDPANDRVYVADSQNNRIQVFDMSGTYITQWGSAGTGDGQFDAPVKIKINISTQNIYVADYNNDRVQIFDNTGTYLDQWSVAGGPYDIELDSSGNVYAATWNNYIRKYTAAGAFITEWGGTGSGDGQFNVPGGIAINNSTSRLFAADFLNKNVQEFDLSGNFISKWGAAGTGDGELDMSDGLWIHPSTGNIYIADSGRDIIQIFNSNGTFLDKWGSAGAGDGQFSFYLNSLEDIEYDSGSERYFVTDYENDRIQVFGSCDTTPTNTPTISPTTTQTITQTPTEVWTETPAQSFTQTPTITQTITPFLTPEDEIDDFEDNDLTFNLRNGVWENSASGTSAISMSVTADAATGSYALEMLGEVSGSISFAAIGCQTMLNLSGSAEDRIGFDGIRLYMKGEMGTGTTVEFRVELLTPLVSDYSYYRYVYTPDPGWTYYEIPWSSFINPGYGDGASLTINQVLAQMDGLQFSINDLTGGASSNIGNKYYADEIEFYKNTETFTPTITHTQQDTPTYTPTITPTASPTDTEIPYHSPTVTETMSENDDVDGDDSYTAPQPAQDFVKFVFRLAGDADVKIYIYNFAGKTIGRQEQACYAGINRVQVDTSKLPPGVYYYIITADNGSGSLIRYRTKKFFVGRAF